MVVDDDKNLIYSLVKILKFKKFKISYATSGPEAIEMAKTRDYDLIFMDIKMPGMDGVKAFKKIKKFSPKTQFVLMTAYSRDNLIKDALTEGIYRILYKPLDADEIITLINKFSIAKSGNVLIIDDDKSFSESFRKNIERVSYKCDIAYTGDQALELMKNDEFEIIFIDIKLPDLNGLDLLMELKEIKPDIIAIMMTGFRNENKILNLIQKALNNTAYSYLLKPFEFSEVINLLDEVKEIH